MAEKETELEKKSVFDQSYETQNKKYEEFLQNEQEIRKVIEWYKVRAQHLEGIGAGPPESNVNQFGFLTRAIGYSPYMIGSLESSLFGQDLVSQELAQKVIDKINEHPQIVFETPVLEILHSATDSKLPKKRSFRERIPSVKVSRTKWLENIDEVVREERLRNAQLEIEKARQSDVERIAGLFGFPSLNYTEAAVISQVVSNISETFREATFWYFSFQEIRKMILAICPDIGSKEKEIEKQTVFLNFNDGYSALSWGNTAVADLSMILVQSQGSEHSIDHSQATRMLIFAHEYLHNIILYLLEESFERWAKSLDQLQQQGEIPEDDAANIFRTILEGTSIALEYDLIKGMTEFLTDQEDKNDLEAFAKFRINNLKKANLLHNEKYKLKMLETIQRENPQFSRDLEKHSMVSYSDGALVAMALRRNGWTMKDLPLLIAEISKIIKEVSGAKKIKDLMKIELSTDEQSNYMKILSRVKALKR